MHLLRIASPVVLFFKFRSKLTNMKVFLSASPLRILCLTLLLMIALKKKYELRRVDIGEDRHINTLIMGRGPPLVMLHGFGGGIGAFVISFFSLI